MTPLQALVLEGKTFGSFRDRNKPNIVFYFLKGTKFSYKAGLQKRKKKKL